MSNAELSVLEKNILRAKGVNDQGLAALTAAGISSKADFAVVGDAETLAAVTGLEAEAAERVMAWAMGETATSGAAGTVTIDSPDVVHCAHCQARQPKDYKSGDLCLSCGQQAEPTRSCFWCGESGPGQFCRGCGTRFVAIAEFELALMLRRDGYPRDDIPTRLQAMAPAEKDALWARVRQLR
ncbi:MAG: hypothetical protein MI794_07310 [Pseudomonadales bacterium]|uniref:hypothetical protein n=1 Tax=Marinobacter xestospongiae TaxID=994319 RepID=UPI002003C225|nr:hypothetical protein [Marinobacter xestospongiae]MCG8517783.1 hypothetical protein [Pseudomonadales bacterium]MCK7565531.1 hypothetical protein [Marinobacter xestospongiae]